MHRLILNSVLALGMVLIPTIARAEDPMHSTAVDPFGKGSVFVSLTTDNVWAAVSQSRAFLYGGAFGLHYYVADHLAIIGEVPITGTLQDGKNAFASGLTLLVRYHLFNIDRFSLFIDGGSGFLWSTQDLPVNGTRFNFLSRAGIGATYRLDDDWFIEGGARAAHLSNAGIAGTERNPGLDLAVEGYLGVMYKF